MNVPFQACYRHPDSPAGVSCQRCHRPICPRCMVQASVGFQCPDCMYGVGVPPPRPVPAKDSAPATRAIIGLNVVAFVAMLATANVTPSSMSARFLEIRGYGGGLYAEGALFAAGVPDQPWRLVLSGFLHSNDMPFGVIHIGMNMYALWIFGQLLERALGRPRLVALYMASLMGGSLGVVLLSPRSVTVGASGAVFGLFGAAIVLARSRGVNLWQSGLMTTLVINLLITFGVPGISIGGHLGGLVTGAAVAAGMLLLERQMPGRDETVATAATACLALVLGGAAFLRCVAEFGSSPVFF